MLPSEPDRFSPQLFPPVAMVRQRLAENQVEAEALRRLLRVVEDVQEHRCRSAHTPRQPQGGSS